MAVHSEDVSLLALSRLFLQGLVQAGVNILREWNWFNAGENLNGLSRLVHNHGAVLAMLQMTLEFLLQGGVQVAVDVVRQFANDAFAIQLAPPWRK